jgi:hypothetical protein
VPVEVPRLVYPEVLTLTADVAILAAAQRYNGIVEVVERTQRRARLSSRAREQMSADISQPCACKLIGRGLIWPRRNPCRERPGWERTG